jgi:hypothetical protein
MLIHLEKFQLPDKKFQEEDHIQVIFIQIYQLFMKEQEE